MKTKIYIFRGWWFSPGIADFSTTKTGRHDIAQTLLRGVKTPKIKQNGSYDMKQTYSSIIIVRNVYVLTSASMIAYLFFTRS
jgi:hypothetical protein